MYQRRGQDPALHPTKYCMALFCPPRLPAGLTSHTALFVVRNDDFLAAISAIVGVFHRISKVDQRFHMAAMGAVQPFENDRNIPDRKENRCNKKPKADHQGKENRTRDQTGNEPCEIQHFARQFVDGDAPSFADIGKPIAPGFIKLSYHAPNKGAIWLFCRFVLRVFF